MNNSEYYIIAITKMDKKVQETMKAVFRAMGQTIGEKFYVIIPNRKALSEIYRLMPDNYRVESITTLNDTKSFEEFKKELILNKDNKPKGLDFGDTE